MKVLITFIIYTTELFSSITSTNGELKYEKKHIFNNFPCETADSEKDLDKSKPVSIAISTSFNNCYPNFRPSYLR